MLLALLGLFSIRKKNKNKKNGNLLSFFFCSHLPLSIFFFFFFFFHGEIFRGRVSFYSFVCKYVCIKKILSLR